MEIQMAPPHRERVKGVLMPPVPQRMPLPPSYSTALAPTVFIGDAVQRRMPNYDAVADPHLAQFWKRRGVSVPKQPTSARLAPLPADAASRLTGRRGSRSADAATGRSVSQRPAQKPAPRGLPPMKPAAPVTARAPPRPPAEAKNAAAPRGRPVARSANPPAKKAPAPPAGKAPASPRQGGPAGGGGAAGGGSASSSMSSMSRSAPRDASVSDSRRGLDDSDADRSRRSSRSSRSGRSASGGPQPAVASRGPSRASSGDSERAAEKKSAGSRTPSAASRKSADDKPAASRSPSRSASAASRSGSAADEAPAAASRSPSRSRSRSPSAASRRSEEAKPGEAESAEAKPVAAGRTSSAASAASRDSGAADAEPPAAAGGRSRVSSARDPAVLKRRAALERVLPEEKQGAFVMGTVDEEATVLTFDAAAEPPLQGVRLDAVDELLADGRRLAAALVGDEGFVTIRLVATGALLTAGAEPGGDVTFAAAEADGEAGEGQQWEVMALDNGTMGLESARHRGNIVEAILDEEPVRVRLVPEAESSSFCEFNVRTEE